MPENDSSFDTLPNLFDLYRLITIFFFSFPEKSRSNRLFGVRFPTSVICTYSHVINYNDKIFISVIKSV